MTQIGTAQENAAPGSDAIRVLVVEDETLIGLDLVMMLENWGYAVDGPYRDCNAAIAAVQSFDPHLGILDINLGHGQTSLPIARELSERGKKMVFLTGYSATDETAENYMQDIPRLPKPVSEAGLRTALRRILNLD